jgi:hypothetical protein
MNMKDTKMQTMSKTWEEAAEVAVAKIYDMAIVANDTSVDSLIKFMRHRFDQTINGIENYNYVPQSLLIVDGQGLWSFIGRHALNILTITGWRPDKDEMIATLIRKQKDYGPENIARFGNIGLLIRMHDKIARLENIYAKCEWDFNKAIAVNAVSDETIIDTLIDIMGYSAIAIMWSTVDEDGNRAFLYNME